MALDESSDENDTVTKFGDISVVIKQKDLSAAGGGVTVDYRESPAGAGFFIDAAAADSGSCSSCSGSCGSES